jgi:hypothetical protein
MNVFKRLQWRAPLTVPHPAPARDMRPLSPVATFAPMPIVDMIATPAYAQALSYFCDYPASSLMGDHSRALLFALIRMLRPQVVAEIGTLYAGTTEILARSLWENGGGLVYTTDPFGAERCPAIIGKWPSALRDITRFYPMTSMNFFLELERQKVAPGLILVDGNHDHAFALFDLLMAAKLVPARGHIVMDNSEQSGPFHAARTFLGSNPGWAELGNAVAAYDPSDPFKQPRSSVPSTSFLILQAPAHLCVGLGPHSWGQAATSTATMGGFSLDLPAQATAGTLHYQAILRLFAEGNRDVAELKSSGALRLQHDGPATTLEHRFKETLRSSMVEPEHFTFEIELSWQAGPGAPPLRLASIPALLPG